MQTRRDILKFATGLGLGAGAGPLLFGRKAFAGEKQAPVFVFLFLPGAMDGLAAVAPLDDPNYRKWRPNIRVSESEAYKLGNGYALHPGLKALGSFWEEKELALFVNAGSGNPNRSHFQAQDAMQISSGNDGRNGFLGRALDAGAKAPLRAVAFQPSLPLSLNGDFPALCVNSLPGFSLRGRAEKQKDIYEMMYGYNADPLLRNASQEAFLAQKVISRVQKQPKSNVEYPKNGQSAHFRDLAQMIKANVGLEVAALQWTGWDTHVNQGADKGTLARNFQSFAETIVAFRKDLGAHWPRVVVVAMSEFGRTVRENGTRGTDHGHGSTIFAIGSALAGQRVLGEPYRLQDDFLFEGRDLPVHTDFRLILSEVLTTHMGYGAMETVFPGIDHSKSLNLFKAPLALTGRG